MGRKKSYEFTQTRHGGLFLQRREGSRVHQGKRHWRRGRIFCNFLVGLAAAQLVSGCCVIVGSSGKWSVLGPAHVTESRAVDIASGQAAQAGNIRSLGLNLSFTRARSGIGIIYCEDWLADLYMADNPKGRDTLASWYSTFTGTKKSGGVSGVAGRPLDGNIPLAETKTERRFSAFYTTVQRPGGGEAFSWQTARLRGYRNVGIQLGVGERGFHFGLGYGLTQWFVSGNHSEIGAAFLFADDKGEVYLFPAPPPAPEQKQEVVR